MSSGCIQVVPEKCTGCRICELICSLTRYGESNPKRSRIRVVKLERFFVDVPVACKQCPDPSCAAECPTEVLKKGADHIMKIDEGGCTGCGQCVEACALGAISIDPSTQTAIVCDLCQGEPRCVQWCPTGALEFNPSMHVSQGERWNAAALTARSLMEKWSIPRNEYEEYLEKFEGRKSKIE
ncbi:MAG: 4Fe-4S dicluster domain-containing protein [Thermodesulfobacteriota bacterium]|nr:4Fe-4S dicluster domain-containing protein [Thermodesulfobacteriota bacterium]